MRPSSTQRPDVVQLVKVKQRPAELNISAFATSSMNNCNECAVIMMMIMMAVTMMMTTMMMMMLLVVVLMWRGGPL